MMEYTHIWNGPTTGSAGLLLIPGQPFIASDHDYLDIEEAEENGRAKRIDEGRKEKPSEQIRAKPVTKPAVEEKESEVPKESFPVQPEKIDRKPKVVRRKPPERKVKK